MVNEYIPHVEIADIDIKSRYATTLVNNLHSAGYIHGDITEPSNIDTTFHIDDIDKVDIDWEEEYGTRDPKKIMDFEKGVIKRRYDRSIYRF